MTNGVGSLAWLWDGSTEHYLLGEGCLEVTKSTEDNAFALQGHVGKHGGDSCPESHRDTPMELRFVAAPNTFV